ncbi:ABC transporter substrate-binding protein [Halalkalibacter akibai]|uniref:Vitamin B12 ABC transporter n=1 Tax=Halalkalibacter akibai (strain ATCC 43226 / DSM 21942 / CIP 109018 / JCM 9157 / 1139) TaxID=1236973 RepID=W4QW55_HALA3|nr:ABC transporter substrate-binding protein [Halalkalibacter akibai]GAE35868.1 vitamin B12 ABC transporter [Halalkalibacter akibai JCM 9157]
MKQFKFLLMALFLVMFVAGCGQDQATETEPGADTDVEVTEPTDEQVEEESGAYPLTVTDAVGEEVTIEAQPERIVTLVPSVTETVFAVGAGEAVVGRSEWDNYPEEVLEIESIGGMEFDVEKIISLSPDLVLAHESGVAMAEEGLNQLRNAGLVVVVVPNATSIADVYQSIQFIGTVTGYSDTANEIVTNMQADFAVIEEKASEITEEDRKRVWVEIGPAPEIYTTGSGTFMDEMLSLINAENVAGNEEGWPMFTEEEAVAFNPDVILLTYGHYFENATEAVKARTAWADVPAVANDQVYELVSDEVERPGPRLARGVEQIAKAVYPEVFGE